MMMTLALLVWATLAAVARGQDCDVLGTRLCITDILEEIQNRQSDVIMCQTVQDMRIRIDTCNVMANEFCTEGDKVELEQLRITTQASVDNICNNLPTTTTAIPTEPPVPCGTTEGWIEANKHIVACKKRYETIESFKYATKLNKAGVCNGVQGMIDCTFSRGTLNSCDAFQLSFKRELVAYILFGQMFGCTDITVNGERVEAYKQDQVCDVWAWLECHSPLLQLIPGIDSVTASEPRVRETDLNSFVNLDIYPITAALLEGSSSCSAYNSVNWNQIKRCTATMEDRCDILREPSRSSLWSNVLALLYSVSRGVHDTVDGLMTISAICESGCADIQTRINKIENECKANAGDNLPTTIIEKFNNDQQMTAECSLIQSFRDCIKNTVIGDCGYMEEEVVYNLHLDTLWILALQICQVEPMVTAKPGCHAEATSETQIITQCVVQRNSALTDILMRPTTSEKDFCYYLQQAANCYAQHVYSCSALEERYWSAELSLVSAANQMLGQCDIRYQTYGNTMLKAVDKSSCDMRQWVSCMAPLWTALGVNPTSGYLDISGFKKLLALVWHTGTDTEKMSRCSAVSGLDFGSMAQCVSGLNMECDLPQLAIPDGVDYEQALRDPFDIEVIRDVVREDCSSACMDTEISKKVIDCLDYEDDITVAQTYPKDIIYSAFVGDTHLGKCKSLTTIKDCLEYHLNPDTCPSYASSVPFVYAADYKEAMIVCANPPKRGNGSDDDGDPTTGAAGVALSVVCLLASLLARIV